MCEPFDYQCWKRRCNTSGVYSPSCLDFFLTLPRGDIGIQESRQDFAGETCGDVRYVNQLQCRLLCRDAPAVCYARRRTLCEGVTLEDIQARRLPSTSPLYTPSQSDPSLLDFCACYLDQSQYVRVIEAIGVRLGQSVANSIMRSINFPQCFFSDCARSLVGGDTQYEPCQAVNACVQSIQVDVVSAITANVCNIGNARSTTTPTITQYYIPTWAWIVLVLSVVFLVGILVLLLIRKRTNVVLKPVLIP